MTRLNSMDGLSPLAIIENPYTHLFLQAHVKRYSPGVSFECGRTWQPFVGGKNGHENFRQARTYNFRDKCIVFACKLEHKTFDGIIAN